MAFTTINKYSFRDINQATQNSPFFELTSIQLDSYCVSDKNEISNYYRIYWIEDGTGTYQVDFHEFTIEGSGFLCLSPRQVFVTKSEKVKSAYQIAFDKDFYCVETHGKEIACNGLLFNNVHRASVVSVDEEGKVVFKSLIGQMIQELENRGSAHQELLETYLRMFLIHSLRLLDKQELDKNSVTHQQHPLAQDFIALVEKHFKTEHTVTGYAEKLFVSPKSRVFPP